jgi:Zinc finger, C3HC4 type (RING finger)
MADQTILSWLSPNSSSLLDSAKSAVAGAFRIPSSKDLISFPVRVAGRIDRAIVQTIPNYLLTHSGVGEWAAQARNGLNAYMDAGAGDVAAGAGAAPAVISGWRALLGEAVQAGTLKSYTGLLSYLTSRWAFTCFAMALILNRVAVYGSSRQKIHLAWNRRLALRLLPVMLFVAQIYKLLQAIQCQSSPDFIDLRLGAQNASEAIARGVEWQSQDGFLHWMSTSLLFASSDADSCAARGMSSDSPGLPARYGSYSLLWPTFVCLCLSHLLDTISARLQQIPVMTEIAMSIFEHSLAFAEVEIMISQTLAVGAFSTQRTVRPNTQFNITEVPLSGVVLGLADATESMTGSHRLDRVNVPIEVLLVAFLSCCNALTSNIISIFGKQRSLRLINTGFWGCCFIASFIWAFLNESFLMRTVDGEIEASRAVSSLLHFPTVVICGFIPHMIVLAGMGICLLIYTIALILTAFSLNTNPNIPQPSGILDRFEIAHDNLQAAIQVRGINFKYHEDFYTALLRIGFTALTAASEAVFLNEGRSVEMRQFTWLEEDRLDEIEASYSGPEASQDSTFQIAEAYGVPPSLPWTTTQPSGWQSGYTKERKLEKDKETGMDKIGENTIVYPNPGLGGVGAMQRTTRFYLLFIFIRGIFFLVGGYTAWAFGVFLDRIRITARPGWLRDIVGKSRKTASKADTVGGHPVKPPSALWLMDSNGKLTKPTRDDIDIASEIRRMQLLDGAGDTESVLDERIYGWWKMGGWFGTKDESSDYRPALNEDIDDTTSIYSMTTTTSVSGNESDPPEDELAWESEPEGQRTPTRQSPHLMSREQSLEPNADTPLDPLTLARLLNPQDKAAKDEARMLAAHLSNPNRIITRSTYRKDLADERSRLLLAGRSPGRRIPKVSLYATSSDDSPNRPLTPAEEVEVLESLILSRRKRKRKPATQPAPTDESDNFHAQGPSCVVCQASPRTIIAWPCRCLCVCEDCRVNLALNNFGNCVTCRRQVGGFVRLWVP